MLTLTKTEKLLFNRLVHLAQLGRLTSYSEEAVRLNPPMLARHPVYCKMLDRINRYSYEHYGVFLAAIVKHKSSDTVGLGFFVAISDCMAITNPADKLCLKQNWTYYHKIWKDSLADLFAKAKHIKPIEIT